VIQLVGLADVARMLGVSRERARQIAEGHEVSGKPFPKAHGITQAGRRVWRLSTVERWISQNR
jgi:predicted DNA-binding transcriptional regulator AlpA